jgi:predicted deacylase
MSTANPIKSDIDFDAPGKQVGYLRLPHSVNRSAYGWIPIPVASIRNGTGPTFLITAGSHGDEYEGQIIVARLIRELQPSMIQGQVILLPMTNFPAAEAGTRTSPLDDGNLNRLYPGNPAGTPTQVIAHYIESVLLARAEYMVDLHSGGTSLIYEGANMMGLEPRDAELGGGGQVSSGLVDLARQGLLNLLAHVGILSGELVPASAPTVPRMMRIEKGVHYVYALNAGLWEPLVELGDQVEAGQPAALIHFPDDPLREPVTVHFAGSGEVICKRALAQVRVGDCLLELAGLRSGIFG